MSFTSFIKPESDPNIIVPTKPFNLSPNIVERFSLKDKVTVITGGAGAIGGAIAEGYAQAGGHVILLDYADNDNGLSARLAKTYGIKSKFIKIDVTDAKHVEQVINQIDEEFGTIDVLLPMLVSLGTLVLS